MVLDAKRLEELYSTLDYLDRQYELMDTMGHLEEWKKQRDAAQQEADLITENATPEELAAFYGVEVEA